MELCAGLARIRKPNATHMVTALVNKRVQSMRHVSCKPLQHLRKTSANRAFLRKFCSFYEE